MNVIIKILVEGWSYIGASNLECILTKLSLIQGNS